MSCRIEAENLANCPWAFILQHLLRQNGDVIGNPGSERDPDKAQYAPSLSDASPNMSSKAFIHSALKHLHRPTSFRALRTRRLYIHLL